MAPSAPPPSVPISMAALTLQQGLELHSSGRLAEAEALYKTVLEQYPTSVQGQHFLAVLRMQQGDFFEALELLANALEHCPRTSAALGSFVPTLLKLATELNDLCHYEAAVVSYELLLAVEPDNPAYITARCVAPPPRADDEAMAAAEQILARPRPRHRPFRARGGVAEARSL
jgi:tetratricopeptide (TPR) repeat protein